MSRIDSSVDTHVCYATLKFSSPLLADERDKKQFLDEILNPQGENEYRILAFTVLDDELHFLVSFSRAALRAGRSLMRKTVQRQVRIQWTDEPGRLVREERYRVIRKTQELTAVSREIHLLAVRQGYVTRVRDYWWSSFQTYRGFYSWGQTDTEPVLYCFNEDPEKGRQLFLKYHKECSAL